MITKKRFLVLSTFLVGMLVVALAVTAGVATAGSSDDNSSGFTLTWPDSEETCEPGKAYAAIEGIPTDNDDIRALIQIRRLDTGEIIGNVREGGAELADGKIELAVDYPDVETWPLVDGVHRIDLRVVFQVWLAGDTQEILLNEKHDWWITCEKEPPPPPEDGEGCTPGYWRQEHHFDSWTAPYDPTDDFEDVFGVDASFDPDSLLDAVWLGGGGENALARHAVAALLNAASPDVSYAYSVSDVIAMVQDAYADGDPDFEAIKDLFEAENEAGCPLD